MSRVRWQVLREGPRLTVARHLPVRFDVVAETRLPRAGRLRLAHQIRQDLWRALQRQRGFSPVVEVTADVGAVAVRAGGRVEAAAFDRHVLETRIARVLDAPENRARWLRAAGGRQ